MLTTLKEALGYPSLEERQGLSQNDIYRVIFPDEKHNKESNHAPSNPSRLLRDILHKHGGSEEEIDLILHMLNWSPYIRYTSDQCLSHHMFANIYSSSKVDCTNKVDSQIIHSSPSVVKHRLSEFPRNNHLTTRPDQKHKQVAIPRLNTHSIVQDHVLDFDAQVQFHSIDGQRDLSYSFCLVPLCLVKTLTRPTVVGTSLTSRRTVCSPGCPSTRVFGRQFMRSVIKEIPPAGMSRTGPRRPSATQHAQQPYRWV